MADLAKKLSKKRGFGARKMEPRARFGRRVWPVGLSIVELVVSKTVVLESKESKKSKTSKKSRILEIKD